LISLVLAAAAFAAAAGSITKATEKYPASFQVAARSVPELEAIDKRLAGISGHESTKATIRYPWALADTINSGLRQLTPADFGLPFVPQPVPYDFKKGVQDSLSLLTELESGKDPLWQAKGDHLRHYWFAAANEMMPYHVYAPLKWDGHSKLPMVLVLHGNTRDQDYYFDRDDHILAKLAEQHGYLVVCPMGYRPNAGWGTKQSRQSELSEQDALNVLDLVTKEYPIDSSRVYLFGHSAGGGGSWHMGEKYAGKWAAIATSAAPTHPENFPFEPLKGMPILVCHGDKDDEVPVARSRDMVKASKEHGLDPQYLEVPGATHLTIVALVEPKVFDFFDAHSRKN
jgi:dienelactone hydrolase